MRVLSGRQGFRRTPLHRVNRIRRSSSHPSTYLSWDLTSDRRNDSDSDLDKNTCRLGILLQCDCDGDHTPLDEAAVNNFSAESQSRRSVWLVPNLLPTPTQIPEKPLQTPHAFSVWSFNFCLTPAAQKNIETPHALETVSKQ